MQGARAKEGLTQKALAAILNITQANISMMEHGKRPIGKEMAKRLAAVLNTDYRLCGPGAQGRVLCFGRDEGEGKQVEKRKFMWPNRPVRTAAKPRCGFPSIHDKEC